MEKLLEALQEVEARMLAAQKNYDIECSHSDADDLLEDVIKILSVEMANSKCFDSRVIDATGKILSIYANVEKWYA